MKRRNLAVRLTPKEWKARWKEIHPPLTAAEALVEANRCLYCYEAPCIGECPTHIDIPSFIRKIALGDLRGAARTILSENPLGGSCARVCPTETLCEGACVYNRWGREPIRIGLLQRRAIDHVFDERYEPIPAQEREDGAARVAVIGAGPAGLSCAAVLARLGHAVTVYDGRKSAGGLNRHAIALYKATPKYIDREVAAIRKLGVNIRREVKVGRKPSVADLLEKYDAVFLGPGLGEETRLNIPGENLKGVSAALDFLDELHNREVEKIRVGKRVAVIGCGNTAIDAARAAKRLGAEEVIVLYRRTRGEMPAYNHEYEGALAEGIEFRWLVAPVRLLGRAFVTGARCVSMKLGARDRSGRPRPVPVRGSEHTIACDQVIYSIGQRSDIRFLSTIEGLKTDRHGRVVVKGETMETSVPRLFAGGDCVNGGKEVVNAVQDGKVAARSIHTLIGGSKEASHA